MAQAGRRGPGLRAKMAEEARGRKRSDSEEAVPAQERVARVYGDFKFPRIEPERLAAYSDLKDPYVAAVAACVYGPDRVDGLIMEEPPTVNRSGEVARRWQIGRALWHFKQKENLSLPELARRLGHSHHSAVWEAVALYRAWPDGRLPEQGSMYYLSKTVASQLLKGQAGRGEEGAAVLEGRAVVRRLGAMDDALEDLEGLSRRVGRPLTAQEIERVATKHRVSPLVLMGRWGNHVLASGAATTRDLVTVLQAERSAWQEEKTALQKEVAGLRERLGSLEKEVDGVCAFFAMIAAAVAAAQQSEGRRVSA